ncbi:unnamed protein product [Calicophoron daubneyi]|uniref:ceramide glucosyltransferase n=1 Tax=Calicophoron daubneyi TaxID=300641 RepID=A0AAV2TEW4_CALDB
MSHRHINEEYHIFNVSTKFSAYGYIYYASLYAGESYAIQVLLAIVAVFGILFTVLLLALHLCAIFFAHHHLYKTIHFRASPPLIRHRSCSHRLWSPIKVPFCAVARGFRTVCHCLTCRCSSRTPGSPLASAAAVPAGSSPSVKSSLHSGIIVKLPTLLEDGVIPSIHSPLPVPGVSIIKPLAGMDANLEINLRSYFRLDYLNYEILFCVADPSDPACELVRKLQKLYPHVKSRLIIAKNIVGVNPKVNNLQAGYEAARYELLLISDSGIWMRPDTLTDMVVALDERENIGMIHQIPFMTPYLSKSSPDGSSSPLFSEGFSHDYTRHICTSGSRGPSFAWIVQLVFFGCWHAKIYLCAAFFGFNCTTGMSCLIRKSLLENLDGFKRFGCYLAEDFFLAKYILDQGWQIKVSHQPAWQNSPSGSVSQFFSRIGRWSQLRLNMVFLSYVLEPITRCIPNALLGAFSYSYFLPDFIDPGVYFLCHTLLWFLLDYILLLYIYPPCIPLCITKLEYLVAWVFSEVTAVPFHFSSLFRRELRWRDKRFHIHWGGLSEQIYPVVVSNSPCTSSSPTETESGPEEYENGQFRYAQLADKIFIQACELSLVQTVKLEEIVIPNHCGCPSVDCSPFPISNPEKAHSFCQLARKKED